MNFAGIYKMFSQKNVSLNPTQMIFLNKNVRQKYNYQKIFWEKLKCADASAGAGAAAIITDEPLSFENFS